MTGDLYETQMGTSVFTLAVLMGGAALRIFVWRGQIRSGVSRRPNVGKDGRPGGGKGGGRGKGGGGGAGGGAGWRIGAAMRRGGLGRRDLVIRAGEGGGGGSQQTEGGGRDSGPAGARGQGMGGWRCFPLRRRSCPFSAAGLKFSAFCVDNRVFLRYNSRRKQRRSGEHRTSPPAVCEEVHNFLRLVRKSGFYVRVLCGIRTLHLEVLLQSVN